MKEIKIIKDRKNVTKIRICTDGVRQCDLTATHSYTCIQKRASTYLGQHGATCEISRFN